jgi:two-component system, sensor histidine kinase and response regulator
MGKKILVADDETEIIDLLTTLLESAGFSVVSTTYGSQLFTLLKKEKPDLLILDVLLPGIDGYSLSLHMAEQEETRYIPVLIISAMAASRTLFDKFEQVKGFFLKPFNTDEILTRIKEILDT